MIRIPCIIITIVLVLCASGCQPPAETDAAPVSQIYPEAGSQKAALLTQIQQKYESPNAHYQLGRIYHAEGQYDKAEFEYRVALGFDPVNYHARAGIVKALADQGRTDAAASAAARYMNQEADSAETALRLGRAFQSVGLQEYALQSYQHALTLEPDSAEAYCQLGYFYLGKGDKVQAEQNLRQSFQLDPYQPQVAEELGRMGVVVETPKQPEEQNFLQNMFSNEDETETEIEQEAQE